MDFNNGNKRQGCQIGCLTMWVFWGLLITVYGIMYPVNIPFSYLTTFVSVVILLVGIRFFTYMIKRDSLVNNICQNPSKQTAQAYLEYYKKHRPKLTGVRLNYPKYWMVLRNQWYQINGSNKIPTNLKAEILETFKRDGLYVQDTIIDNYGR